MAADEDLVCNFKKCRKRLKAFAWATSCSHVFCDEDGTREFNKKCTCPACETNLPGKYDIVRVDLQPSEEYKSMVLAGQRPETIMEICSRALSFWSYQSHQERIYQEYCATKLRDKVQQMESYYEQIITRTQAELSSVKTQIETQRKELDSTKIKYNEASEKLTEKTRQYQRLQVMYDTLRRRNVTMATFDGSDHTIVPLSQHHYPTHKRQPLQYELTVGNTQENEITKGKATHHSKTGIGSGVSISSNTTSTHTNIQVDPGLAAAVNVGALQQSTSNIIKPSFHQVPPPLVTHGGEDFTLDFGTNHRLRRKQI